MASPTIKDDEEKVKRHPRWTRQETLILIQAKEITENGPHKGRKIWTSENNSNGNGNGNGNGNSERKWEMISGYCKSRGVSRGAAQCRKRWSNLIGDYKRVKTWELGLGLSKTESFWCMRNDLRKEKKLPVSFDSEVFQVLEGRDEVRAAFSPLPLQAVPAPAVSGSDVDGPYGDEEEEDVEPEPEPEPKPKPEDEPEPVPEPEPEPEEENVVDEVMEFGLKSKDEVSAKRLFESPGDDPEPSSDGLRESWPGISYWNSQDKAKRRRQTKEDNDEGKASKEEVEEAEEEEEDEEETEMMRILKENSKMVNAQLDIHNKNIQLDREQRKETNDVLVAAISKLTNVLAKIAEKL